jgi:outer membrane protein TolC
LDAFGKVTASGDSLESVNEGDNRNDYTAGVSLDVPFDKRPERDAVKRAMIAVESAERSLTETRDTIRVSILDSFQTLQSQRVAAGIEFRNMQIAERQAGYAALRFRNGEADNRDVVDAQNQLLNARNTYVRALVQYEQQRIQLLRDIGLLDVAVDGTLVEMKVP